jgi:hypothetical protein
MFLRELLDAVPIWLVYFATVGLLLLAMRVGYAAGVRNQARRKTEDDSSLNTVIAAALALLAFLLSVSVSLGTTLYNERRVLVVDEANAIGTAWLRAGYVGDPLTDQARQQLIEYTDWRVAAMDPSRREEALAQATAIQATLWKGAEQIAVSSPTPPVSLYISAINDVIDLYSKRVNELEMRVPITVILALYVVALLSMGLLGLKFGYAGTINWTISVLLALILGVAFVLLMDLDRPMSGALRVPQEPLLDLQTQLDAFE